jgi:WD40 repeat protein
VLETGGRHAACDALAFTADGGSLLAAGDDKVVRVWKVTADGLDAEHPQVLRWPTYREQGGSIFALALSPDPANRRLFLGGFGVKPGLVAIVNRTDGQIEHVLARPVDASVVWRAAFAPAAPQAVYGTETGDVYLWDFGPGKKNAVRRLGPPPSGRRNRIRLLAFVGGSRFLSVAEDGFILRWDLDRPNAGPDRLGQFKQARESGLSLFRVALAPDGQHLAAVPEDKAGNAPRRGFQQVELYSLANGTSRLLPLPGRDEVPHCLAFDQEGERLAVGARVVPQKASFFKETGGKVYLYDLRQGMRRKEGPALTYRPEALAFHPRTSDWLATAGGDNHEVCLWNLRDHAGPLTEIRGAGSCLWGVGLSADGLHLGFRETRARDPQAPNAWGAGPWRVFDLRRRQLLPAAPLDFRPLPPREELDGWQVDTSRPYEWVVVAPTGRRYPLNAASGLYDPRVHSLPRCYSFLPAGHGKPVRLAVGHAWGVSLYELRAEGPRLARVMIGHEGEVMALGVSADQKTLVTAGRDQTVAGWSLADFPEPCNPELGAEFVESPAGKLLVRRVEPGSPTWEARLLPGDEIVMLLIAEKGFLYNPGGRKLADYQFVMKVRHEGTTAEALDELRNPRPNRQLVFVWKRGGREEVDLTTVRQHPLWKFFPTRADRGNEWVLWRWRDYYYDTNSPHADAYLGWHVNRENLQEKPAFHPLERFRERFHNPQKVQEALDGFVRNPEKVIFADIEPPDVRLTVDRTALRDQDLKLTLTVKPRAEGKAQALASVTLWVNDYRFEFTPPGGGVYDGYAVTVPKKDLRSGVNRITLIAYNEAGGRGQQARSVRFTMAEPVRGRLYALCVGVGDYKKLVGIPGARDGDKDLPDSVPDARSMHALLLSQDQLYHKPNKEHVKLLTERQVTARAVLDHLKELATRVSAQDTFVLFLAGHGCAEEKDGNFDPTTWFFACHDTSTRSAATRLDSRRLYDRLVHLRCRKVILLDTCHSGAVAIQSDPVRALTRDGVPLFIFSACGVDELSAGYGGHGIFTGAILSAVQGSGPHADQDGDGHVDARELAVYLRREVPRRLAEIVKKEEARDTDVGKDASQHPVVFPQDPGRDLLFSKR